MVQSRGPAGSGIDVIVRFQLSKPTVFDRVDPLPPVLMLWTTPKNISAAVKLKSGLLPAMSSCPTVRAGFDGASSMKLDAIRPVADLVVHTELFPPRLEDTKIFGPCRTTGRIPIPPLPALLISKRLSIEKSMSIMAPEAEGMYVAG